MTSTVAQTIGFYSYLFTSPLGFIGHTCSLITFLSKTLRLTSTAFLFISLAISDTLCLSMYIYDFITLTLQLPTRRSEHLCRFRTFILNFSNTTSAWFLVLIAIDRFVRTRFPYRQARICTRKVAAYSVAVVCICSALLTCHVLQQEFAYSNPMSNLCGPLHSPTTSYSIFYYNTWPILQLIITYIIPSCLMIVSVIGVHSKLRVQRTLVAVSMRQQKKERQMLILMISSVGCFAICTLPFAIYRIVYQKIGTSSQLPIEIYILVIFLNMNYSYNFYIYCLTSQLFRETFIEQLKLLYMWFKRPNHHVVYPLPTITGPRMLPVID